MQESSLVCAMRNKKNKKRWLSCPWKLARIAVKWLRTQAKKSVQGMNVQKRRFKVNCAFCRHQWKLTANNPSCLAFTASRRSALPQSTCFTSREENVTYSSPCTMEQSPLIWWKRNHWRKRWEVRVFAQMRYGQNLVHCERMRKDIHK